MYFESFNALCDVCSMYSDMSAKKSLFYSHNCKDVKGRDKLARSVRFFVVFH